MVHKNSVRVMDTSGNWRWVNPSFVRGVYHILGHSMCTIRLNTGQEIAVWGSRSIISERFGGR